MANTHLQAATIDEVWDHLSGGISTPWLDAIRDLRTEEDGTEASLDIWSIALAAELKVPDRREAVSVILTRLSKLPEAG